MAGGNTTQSQPDKCAAEYDNEVAAVVAHIRQQKAAMQQLQQQYTMMQHIMMANTAILGQG